MNTSAINGTGESTLAYAKGEPRRSEKSLFKVQNTMVGFMVKMMSNAANIEQLLEDYAVALEAKIAQKGGDIVFEFDWEEMAIAVGGKNSQEYHECPAGGRASITEGKNTSGK